MAINWSNLLAADPLLPSLLGPSLRLTPGQGAYGTQDVANLQSFLGSARGAVARFGYVPDFTGTPYAQYASQILDQPVGEGQPTARQLAEQGTAAGVSQWADLTHSANVARANALSALTSQGANFSGALGTTLNELGLKAAQGKADATQALLGNIADPYNTYLGQRQDLLGKASSATNDALTRIIAGINAGLYAD